MNSRYRIYAALGLVGALLLGGGFLVVGRAGSTDSAAAPQIKPLHPVKSSARRATHALVRKSKPAMKKAATPLAPPHVAKTQPAVDGMPAALSAALARHSVVVVSLVVPGAPVDEMALQEAKAGSREAGAGFVRISTADNDDVQALSTLVGSSAEARNRLLDAPATLIFRRPRELYVRINGYIDADTVAQAAENAAPATNVLHAKRRLDDSWVKGANAVCTELRAQLTVKALNAKNDNLLGFVQDLVDTVKGGIDKIRALTPPAGKKARVAAMLAAYDRMLRDANAELAAARRNDFQTFQRLNANVQRDSAAADAIAAELGATACGASG